MRMSWLTTVATSPAQSCVFAMVVSVMCTPTDCAVMTSPQPRLAPAGRGAYAIRALPDLCLGIVSEGPGHLDPWIGQLLESLGCARGSLFYVSVRGATEPSASYCVGQLAITRPARLRQRAALRLVIQSQLQTPRRCRVRYSRSGCSLVPEGASGILNTPQLSLKIRIGWVEQNRDQRGSRNQLAEEPQSLSLQHLLKDVRPGCVAARSIEAHG